MVVDFSVPHEGFIARQRASSARRILHIGPRVVAASDVASPDNLAITVSIDGWIVQQTSTANMQRPSRGRLPT